MLQDIGEHKIEVVYDPKAVLGYKDYVIGFEEKEVLVKEKEKDFCFLTCEELLTEGYQKETFEKYQKDGIFLMRIDGRALFLLPDKYFKRCGKTVRYPVNIMKSMDAGPVSYGVVNAWHLKQWYDTTRFCGACGIRLRHSKSERAMECPICGNIIYPHISPAVIVGVVHGDKILVTKYDKKAKYYALVAGYCEIGETIEDTVHREVFEETGVKVKNLKYYKSQPWGFSGSLLSGFFVTLDGKDQIHMDEHELSVARWISRSELDGKDESRISLTGEMIEYFRIHPEAF